MDIFYFLVSKTNWTNYHENFFNTEGGFATGVIAALIIGALIAIAFYFGCCNSSKSAKQANIAVWALALLFSGVVGYFYADWQIIGRVRESLRIPVIANGDVRNVQDMIKIRQVTGCEAVMVGRAAQGNPWIFRQLTEDLRSGAVLPGPTMDERKEVIIRHLDMLLKFKGDYIGPREMRKHATWYTKGIKGSAELRCLFNQAVCRDDFLRILDKMK